LKYLIFVLVSLLILLIGGSYFFLKIGGKFPGKILRGGRELPPRGSHRLFPQVWGIGREIGFPGGFNMVFPSLFWGEVSNPRTPRVAGR